MNKNLKKLLIVPLTSVAMLATSNSEAAEKTSAIATLDVTRIIAEAKATQSINQQIEKLRTSYQSEIYKREASLKKKEKELIEQQKKLSPEAFEKKRKEFEAEVSDLQQSIMNRNNELGIAAQKAMGEVRKVVVDIAKDIATEKGYECVVPVSVLVYATDNNDITGLSITRLNKKLPKMTVKVEKLNLAQGNSGKKNS